GSFYSILWTFDDPVGVNIDYSTDAGGTWTNIDKSVEGAVYHWLVPNTISSNCKIRIISSVDSSVKIMSKTMFAIASPSGVAEENAFPTEFSLAQNFPNPFNPSTVIRYGLPSNSSVTLKIYNMLGQEMATLVEGVQSAGWQSVAWEANVSTGMYFYQLVATDVSNPEQRFTQIKKMVLMK
nr:T9SS type A sorting domain-containing protein [Bacteroidota bacterium]